MSRSILKMGLLVFALSHMPALSNHKEQLKQSQTLSNLGKFQEALDALAGIKVRESFESPEEMIMALEIKAMAYFATHRLDECKAAIEELFLVNADYEPDPFKLVPKLMEMAEREKEAIALKNRRLAQVKNEITLPSQENLVSNMSMAPSGLEKSIKTKPPLALAFFPFGVNQFYLDSPKSGVAYLSLQTLFLASNITGFWWKQSYLSHAGSNYLADAGNRRKFETAQVVQYVGLAGLVLTYGVSVVDALVKNMRWNEGS
jgi:hypothetical protein